MRPIGFSLILCLFGFKGACEPSNATASSLATTKTPVSKFKVFATADLTYASQYVTDGFQVGEGQPVLQPSLRLMNSTYEYSFMYWTSLQTDRSSRQYDEHDLILGFNHNYLNGSRYTFNFHASYDYWFYPNSRLAKDDFGDRISSVEKHGGKIMAGISMLNLLPIAGSFLIPAYNLNYWTYWQDDRSDKNMSGARHELSLKYRLALAERIRGLKKPYAGLFASVNYIDRAFDAKSGWSHSIGSIYIGFEALKVFFTASLNQQWSFERTVNSQDEFWSTLSMTKAF